MTGLSGAESTNQALKAPVHTTVHAWPCLAGMQMHTAWPASAEASADVIAWCVLLGVQEAFSATIHVGPKFPWMEAPRKKYEVDIAQPQWARYIRPNSLPWMLPLYDATGVVTDIQSKVAFEGSITDLVSEALYGKPSEFAFEATVASLYPNNVF